MNLHLELYKCQCIFCLVNIALNFSILFFSSFIFFISKLVVLSNKPSITLPICALDNPENRTLNVKINI